MTGLGELVFQAAEEPLGLSRRVLALAFAEAEHISLSCLGTWGVRSGL